MEHEVFVPVEAQRLREVLGDPARVARAVPGLQHDAGAEPVTGRLKVRIGGSSITYRGSVRVSARDDGGYAVEGEASESRGDGTVRLSLRLTPRPADTGTTLVVTGTATADGRVKDLPQDAVTSAVTRLLTRFAENLATATKEDTAPPESEDAAPPESPEQLAAGDAEAAPPESPEQLAAGDFEPGVTTDFETTPDAEDAPPPPPERGSGAAPDEPTGPPVPPGPSAEGGPAANTPPAPEGASGPGAEPAPNALPGPEGNASPDAPPAPEGASGPGAEPGSDAVSASGGDASSETGPAPGTTPASEGDGPEGVSAPDAVPGPEGVSASDAVPGPEGVSASDAVPGPEGESAPDAAPGQGIEPGSEPAPEPDAPDAPDAGAVPATPEPLDAEFTGGIDGRPLPGDDDDDSLAEAAHARRTMIGRSAEEVDHAPPRGRYAPVPAPQTVSSSAPLRWAAPAAALAVASAVVAIRALRRRR
ncbi:SRPBCC domain-containing protein [Streptomyces sp. MAD19A]|uniref:SRPBCC family protein n=1 Tax=Streptomyces sp. MAD19A TaxID=3242896 RepID=UPI003528410F